MNRRQLLGLGAGAATLAGLGLLAGGGTRTAVSAAPGATRAASVPRQMKVFFSPAYVGAAHAFETTRKSGWVARSLAQAPIAGIQLADHAPLNEADVVRVHEAAYVAAVRTGEPRDLAESQGFAWDPQLWPMVLASNGGIVAAAHEARIAGVSGALSSGLHHARRDRGAGFCTFNGLAIAALQVLERGAKRVLILDLDAHCGGGTHAILGDNPGVVQLDVAVDAFDHYRPRGDNTLDLVERAGDYLPTVRQRLEALAGEDFDLCLYNAGMDPCEGSAIGGLAGITGDVLARREWQVFDWCRNRGLPVAFALAGGYLGPGLDENALVALHRSTLAAAVG